MKKYLLWAAMAAVVITSCTDEEVTNKSDESNNAIEFRTLADKTQSRTSTIDSDNILSFSLTGWWNKGAQFLFNGFDITRSPGIDDDGKLEINTKWNYSPTRYWPANDGVVDFFAYSPASSVNVITDLRQPVNIKPVVRDDSDPFIPVIKYTVPTLESGKLPEDFLVAVTTSAHSTNTGGTVVLNFQHALSKVKFNAIKVNDLEFTIHGIELQNMKQTAELKLKSSKSNPSAGIPTGNFKYDDDEPITLWYDDPNDPSAKANYGLDMGQSPIYVLPGDYTLGDYNTLIGDHNAIMIMPQETKKGTVTSVLNDITKINKKEDDNFYIKIKYKAFLRINNNIIYYAGTEKTPAEYYLTTSKDFTFEIGRSYTFNLTFGNEGSTSGDIKFVVNAKNWDDVDHVNF